jgi:hypothetical protein
MAHTDPFFGIFTDFFVYFCARRARRRRALFDVVMQTCTILMNITYEHARYVQRRPERPAHCLLYFCTRGKVGALIYQNHL